MTTQDEVKELLKKNNYLLDSLYNYYCKKKTMIGYIFTLDKEHIYIKRVKWGETNINESPIKISYRNFEPYVYDLRDVSKQVQLAAIARAEGKARLAKRNKKTNQPSTELGANYTEFTDET